MKDLFICNTIKMKPKNIASILKQFYYNNKKSNNFDFIKKSIEKLNYIDYKNFVLQIEDGYSVESYLFSIYKDKTGFYLFDNKKLRHFHSYENTLKYQLSKIYLDNYSSESINYYCFQYNYNNEESENEYVNNAYIKGTRIIL